MARPKNAVLTDREAEIMNVLWRRQPATSEEIRVELSGKPHDSTVRTLLRVLVEKRQVVADTQVRPTRYRAMVRQKTVRKRAAWSLLKRFFSGSAEELVQQLLDDERLTPEQLKQIEARYRETKTDEDRRR